MPFPIDTQPGWILIHSEEIFNDEPGKYPSPQAELLDLGPLRGVRWHWKLPRAMKEDGRPYRLLLSWEGNVFGEAVASITRHIDASSRHRYNFAFVFWAFRWATRVSLKKLPLGSRRTKHRSLIKLDERILAVFDRRQRRNYT